MLQLQVLNVNHGTFTNDNQQDVQFANMSAYDPNVQFHTTSKPHPTMPGYQGYDVIKYKAVGADALSGFTGPGLYDCGFYMGKKGNVATPFITSMKKVSR